MCRSIKTLRRVEAPATSDEVHAAALQFVRKVSGFRQPSRLNAAAFDEAVAEIARTSRTLLDSLASPARARQASPLHPSDAGRVRHASAVR
jgi:hypothetical protein